MHLLHSDSGEIKTPLQMKIVYRGIEKASTLLSGWPSLFCRWNSLFSKPVAKTLQVSNSPSPSSLHPCLSCHQHMAGQLKINTHDHSMISGNCMMGELQALKNICQSAGSSSAIAMPTAFFTVSALKNNLSLLCVLSSTHLMYTVTIASLLVLVCLSLLSVSEFGFLCMYVFILFHVFTSAGFIFFLFC